jgi:hypothetical protein
MSDLPPPGGRSQTSGKAFPFSLGFPSGSPIGRAEASDLPQESGAPPDGAFESWGAIAIGEEVGRPGAVPFQLAPRLYLLSAEKPGPQGEADPAGCGEPFDELPVHLTFQESPAVAEGRARQTWTSDGVDLWRWELVVEPREGAVLATLTATPPAVVGGNGRRVWTSRGGWEPFGSNRLDPEPGGPGAPALRVAAP